MLDETSGYAVGDGGPILKREEKARAVAAHLMAVKLYPNPARSQTVLSFMLNQSRSVAIQVSDEHGNIVWLSREKMFSSGNQQLSIPVSNLQHGIYQVNVLSKGKTMGSSRLLVVH